MVLVDTSVWIEAARRSGSLEYKLGLEGLIEEAEALICPLIRLEFLSGARPQDRQRMGDSLDCMPSREILQNDWKLARELAWKIADNQGIISARDALIASVAIRWNCRIYAVTPRFTGLEKFGIRLYEPGYGGCFQTEVRPISAPKPVVSVIPATLDIGLCD